MPAQRVLNSRLLWGSMANQPSDIHSLPRPTFVENSGKAQGELVGPQDGSLLVGTARQYRVGHQTTRGSDRPTLLL